MKRNLVLITLMVMTSTIMFAQNHAQRRGVPATRQPIECVQPNGDTLTIRLVGDEWYHYRMTLDGYLIRQNDKGYYCYAKYNEKGEIICTRKKAHNADKRSKCEQRYVKKHIPNKIEERQAKAEDQE